MTAAALTVFDSKGVKLQSSPCRAPAVIDGQVLGIERDGMIEIEHRQIALATPRSLNAAAKSFSSVVALLMIAAQPSTT
jgi:hypothetical protein